ncbi:fatty acyl-CoA reductase wat-like [Zophobas morio]|uniref:fatty acyl-CoA reductase wat-like n=1 Tax=Zophobas morio TaxID=2755281 RepID=UPI003082EDB2
MTQSQICKFYDGQHVFITGGNGFIGKILVEKLLRSTNVAIIYLLMRTKKGKDVYTRLEELLKNEIFNELKEQDADFKRRIQVIVGDNTLPNLGISISDYQTLISKVNIVFHVAATVRFQEEIKFAYDTNVGMTMAVIDLCKQMKNIKSFMYVSTAYSNCYLQNIDEVFYDNLGFDYKEVRSILNEPDGPEKLTRKILQKWPNTYSFTKALAELVIKDFANNLPTGIFRPSIVISTYKEPLEGWTDSLGGPNILVATIASGFLRFFCCDVRFVVDLVPVDMSVAALLASAWDVHQNYKQGQNNIPIYNYVSSVDNPITYDEFIKLNVMVHTERYPFNNCLWTPRATVLRRSTIVNFLLNTTYHYLPALLVDAVSVLCFKKPRMISKYRKFNTSRYQMEYFMAHEWTFTNTNVKTIWNKMNEADKAIFPFDLKPFNWILYFRNYFKGIRSYLAKEPWQNLVSARIKAKRLKIAHQLLLFIIYFIGMTIFYKILQKTIPLRYLRFNMLRKNRI